MTLNEIRRMITFQKESGNITPEFMDQVVQYIKDAQMEIMKEMMVEAIALGEDPTKRVIELGKALQIIQRDNSRSLDRTRKDCLDLYYNTLRSSYIDYYYALRKKMFKQDSDFYENYHRYINSQGFNDCDWRMEAEIRKEYQEMYYSGYKNGEETIVEMRKLPPMRILNKLFDNEIQTIEEWKHSILVKRMQNFFYNYMGLSDFEILGALFNEHGQFMDKEMEIGYWVFTYGDAAYNEYVKKFGEDQLSEKLKLYPGWENDHGEATMYQKIKEISKQSINTPNQVQNKEIDDFER